jgi:hypothetical protein
VWSVHVVAACDDDGQLVAGHVGLAHHLRTSLGGRVGVGGLKLAVLSKAWGKQKQQQKDTIKEQYLLE